MFELTPVHIIQYVIHFIDFIPINSGNVNYNNAYKNKFISLSSHSLAVSDNK